MSVRLTGILILLLAIIAGLVILVRFNRPEKTEDQRPELWDVDDKKINRIEIRLPHEGKKIAFILNKKEDTWSFDDDRHTPLDKKRWGGIVFLLSSPQGKRKIADNIDDLENYGLRNPQLVVLLGIDNIEQPLEILIGNPTPQKDQHYVMLGHSHSVYLVNNTFVEVLSRLVNDPPIHPLTEARDEASGRKKPVRRPKE
jgi:hypothetical protein